MLRHSVLHFPPEFVTIVVEWWNLTPHLVLDDWAHENNKKKNFSFTLYPAHSSVDRGNLALRDFVPHFLPNSGERKLVI